MSAGRRRPGSSLIRRGGRRGGDTRGEGDLGEVRHATLSAGFSPTIGAQDAVRPFYACCVERASVHPLHYITYLPCLPSRAKKHSSSSSSNNRPVWGRQSEEGLAVPCGIRPGLLRIALRTADMRITALEGKQGVRRCAHTPRYADGYWVQRQADRPCTLRCRYLCTAPYSSSTAAAAGWGGS